MKQRERGHYEFLPGAAVQVQGQGGSQLALLYMCSAAVCGLRHASARRRGIASSSRSRKRIEHEKTTTLLSAYSLDVFSEFRPSQLVSLTAHACSKCIFIGPWKTVASGSLLYV